MTETNVSLYKETLSNVEAFLKSLNFSFSQLICEGLVTVVNMISDYHEEGAALNPDILLISKDSFFQTLPCQHHIELCTEEINEKSFSMAVKMCAPLAENGWNMYLLLLDESHLQYGIVNVALTQMSVFLFNQVIETPQELAVCAYIRNIGNKVVELNSISNHCVIALNLNSYETKMEEELEKLANVILKDIAKDFPIKEASITYIKDMFIEALNHGHGNLIAVTDNIEQIKAEEHLRGGIFLSDKIDFIKLLFDNIQQKSDQTATTLNAFTQLAISMLNFDGITIFNSNGCVVGYHFIVDNSAVVDKTIVGGARTRAFEALTQTNGIIACLMKSQDGNIKYFEK
ncbi:hypothetical protein KSW80_10135 [Prevotella copri]|uniref:Uncharacterized protein n=1 Tax=Segatella copri TaxID=165179 RepID=A0AAW4NBB6_9BACT|nr:hypothetical protein [Segatella copri]MBU9911405.1 hypothetical protein [Segatella copri]MBV3408752.1 hypothetical protein [Segatella copri]MBV3411615.1 hypothetical protein [Segatella copri]MBV3420079.1 hypothetical protein [Segatella copri]MBV3473614.1 hypothetical protein [Segatella copri]